MSRTKLSPDVERRLNDLLGLPRPHRSADTRSRTELDPDLERRLNALADRYSAATRAAEEALAEIREAVREVPEGVSLTAVANAAGISRPTLYKFLDGR